MYEHAAIMYAHLRRMLTHEFTLREITMMYFLGTQTEPVNQTTIIHALGLPDSAGTARAVLDGPIALGVIEQIEGENSRGKKCWFYALTDFGRRTLRLPKP